jgi:cell division protein FtsB
MIPVLTKAIQELKASNDELREEINELRLHPEAN